ncbi:CubicO group peptidase (beta-lactamase class C family) [Streptococcus moroccensis]|uniref:CubicO group peptidase (Beta-lactamase class C family) n=1 Tax=Streptococcus moroccensis TaxID=1451356 RepID=A0ABT9YPA7_9STRE|nr:CubicO group peptidase (beta-lactamase class C family) [Streptococcus moroccensis]
MIVRKEGKVVYHNAFGYAGIQGQVPMNTDTILRLA